MKPKAQKLKNGLKILKIPYKDTKAVTVLVLVKVGSRYESPINNGSSHFVEHLMFKGTPKRPNTLIISQELDKIGAEYNAFTGKDHTGYYIKARADKIEFCLDMLSDILFNSLFDKQEIGRERGVILEEINMYEDTPMIYCGELLEELMYGKDHALGQLTIGPRKVIKNISRNKLLSYKNKFYNPSNMVLTISGKIDKKTNNLINKYFSNNIAKKKAPDFKKFSEKQNKKRINVRYQDTEQVHIALGFPGHRYLHPDLPAEVLLSVILGGNMSSRLFINIRERKGLAYFIKADTSIYEDTGGFIVQAGIDKKRIYEAIKAILTELEEIKENGVEKEELKKAQDYLAGRVALDLEDSSSLGSWYARQELLEKNLVSPEEKLKQYRKVTPGDIKRVANKIFQNNKINLSVIGPFKEKSKFNKILILR